MKIFTTHGEYPALYRCGITVQAEDVVGACRAVIDGANQSDSWKGLDWEQPTYVAALVRGEHIDPWRRTPEGGDASTLRVPGLFTDVATLAVYSATRSEALVLQLRIMIDAIAYDGRSRIDPGAMARLSATGRAMLDDVDRCGLAEQRPPSSEGGLGRA